MRERDVATGDFVFRQGDRVRAVFSVIKGEVCLCRFGRRGEEVVLQRARAGDFFAEAALDSQRYHCHAIASEATRLLEISARALRELLKTNQEFAQTWVTLLAQQLRNARTRLERVALSAAADRIRHYLATEGEGPRREIIIPGTLKDFARDLGLAHETLYRTLAELESRGEIQREGRHLRLRAV
jgi:CRP-like cAMP-binding protein